MDVQVGIPVRDPDGGRVYVIEPVVGRDLPGCIQYQAAQGVSLIGIGLDAPVLAVDIFLDGRLHIDLRRDRLFDPSILMPSQLFRLHATLHQHDMLSCPAK